jgi:hypothetical protein
MATENRVLCIISELQVRKEHSDGDSCIIESYITVLFTKHRKVKWEGHVHSWWQENSIQNLT